MARQPASQRSALTISPTVNVISPTVNMPRDMRSLAGEPQGRIDEGNMTRIALTISPTVNMPRGMRSLAGEPQGRIDEGNMTRIALTISPTVNMPRGMLRLNDQSLFAPRDGGPLEPGSQVRSLAQGRARRL